MFQAKVDVLLPTYNGEMFLAEQIESILGQTFQNITLRIRDDGSTDNTAAIIDNFKNKDHRIIVEQDNLGNLGLVKSIEKLLGVSNADLIFFADQDDVWFPEKIQIFLNNYTSDKQARLVHSNCLVTDENLNVKGKFLNDKYAAKTGIRNSYFNYFVQGASSMINKKLKELLLPFPQNIYIHDRYFHIMAELFGSRTYIPQATMLYRQHNNNLIGRNSVLEKIANFKLNKNFVLPEDKLLFSQLLNKYPDNADLALYVKLTNPTVSRSQKLKLINNKNISMRLKEKLLLVINN